MLKATQWWSDLGEGEFDLFYLRTKDGKEVDFLVTQDNNPWFIVEVKNSEKAKLNPHLKWFQERTNAQHAFQVYFDGDQVVADCFSYHEPIKVPVLSLLGQLV